MASRSRLHGWDYGRAVRSKDALVEIEVIAGL
jgi:hypothetical protein